MKPIRTKSTNGILKPAPEDEGKVADLPITRSRIEGIISSCWKMNWKERIKVLFSGRVWFDCSSKTHPPIRLRV